MKKARLGFVSRLKKGKENNNKKKQPPTVVEFQDQGILDAISMDVHRTNNKKNNHFDWDDDMNSSLPTYDSPPHNVLATANAAGAMPMLTTTTAHPYETSWTTTMTGQAYPSVYQTLPEATAYPQPYPSYYYYYTGAAGAPTVHPVPHHLFAQPPPPQPPQPSARPRTPQPPQEPEAPSGRTGDNGTSTKVPSFTPVSSIHKTPTKQQKESSSTLYRTSALPESNPVVTANTTRPTSTPGNGSYVPSLSPEKKRNNHGDDVVWLKQQLRDAQRVVFAVLGVQIPPPGTREVDSSSASIRAIRQYATVQKEISSLKKQLSKAQRQRQELESQWTEVCVERNQQAMRLTSLEQSLRRSQRQNRKLQGEKDQLSKSLSEYTGGELVSYTGSKSQDDTNNKNNNNNQHRANTDNDQYEFEMEQQLNQLQELLDQRHEEMTLLQTELAKARERELETPEGLLERVQSLEQHLADAQAEIQELEEERQLNMTEIVDLSKQLKQQGAVESMALVPADSEEFENQRLLLITQVEELQRQLGEARSELEEAKEARIASEAEYANRIEHLNSLKPPPASSTTVKELENLVKAQQTRIGDWQKMSEQHQQQMQALRTALLQEQALRKTQIETQLQQHQVVVQDLTQHQRSYRERIANLQREVATVQSKLEESQMRYREARLKAQELENNQGAESLPQTSASVSGERHAMQWKLSLQESELSQREVTIQELVDEVKKFREEKEFHRKKVAELQQKLDNQADSTELKLEVLELQAKLNTSQATIDKLEGELEKAHKMLQEEKDRPQDTFIEHLAKIELLENALARKDNEVSELQVELQVANDAASAAAAVAALQHNETQRRGSGSISFQLKEAREALRQKEEDYVFVRDQVVELRTRLHQAQTSVEDLQLELNFNVAKVGELNQLLVIEPEDVPFVLKAKSLECAKLATQLERAQAILKQNHRKIETLEQETEVSQAKVAELSAIWDSLPMMEAAKQELEQNVEKVAQMLDETQVRAKQLQHEKEVAVNKAADLSIALAEAKEAVDDLAGRLEFEEQENQKKERLLLAAGMDTDSESASSWHGKTNSWHGSQRDDDSVGSGKVGMATRNFFFRKFTKRQPKPVVNGRIQELEETLAQQQVTIARLKQEYQLKDDNGDTQPSLTATDTDDSREPDGDKATGVFHDGDGPSKPSLSLEQAQEVTIHRLMKKIELLEEEKTEQSESMYMLKRTLEEVRHENVAKSIQVEAMTTPTKDIVPPQNVLSELKMAGSFYSDTLGTLRKELWQLRSHMEERAMESASQMKQLEQDNMALSVKLSTIESGIPA